MFRDVDFSQIDVKSRDTLILTPPNTGIDIPNEPKMKTVTKVLTTAPLDDSWDCDMTFWLAHTRTLWCNSRGRNKIKNRFQIFSLTIVVTRDVCANFFEYILHLLRLLAIPDDLFKTRLNEKAYLSTQSFLVRRMNSLNIFNNQTTNYMQHLQQVDIRIGNAKIMSFV
jgi:hypothetical protein